MQFERSKEWWLARIAGEVDVPIGASSGLPAISEDPEAVEVLAGMSFGELVHLLRRREGLSVDHFADAVDIELSDAQAIEEDPYYRADMRTVWAISQRFDLSQALLNEMAGIVVANDESFINQERYAARSTLQNELSSDEIALLNIVVSVIEDRAHA